MEEVEKTWLLEAKKHQHESISSITIPNERLFILGEILGFLQLGKHQTSPIKQVIENKFTLDSNVLITQRMQ
jgi:hypothetical protein